MLHNIITYKKKEWISSPECSVKSLLDYMREKGELRETQIEAIEQYLFLKISGENRPLWRLFSEGFFRHGSSDLATVNINEAARNYLDENMAARSLFDFSRTKVNGSTLLPDLEKLIIQKPDQLGYERIIKSIFYNVDYADYLFSLPMGAGKTFLMAAFMYLDLYFAQLEPENKNFAHNFLVLVPSGLKSSIVPSLKTIENFDPSWIIPEPAASNIKKLLKFEVLDQPKSGKKSNKARNPNAQKVNLYLAQPDLMGLILVVNAEKVILDRLELSKELELIERTEDEKDKYANELRNLIGKIPNVELIIDEVHHAATDDVKLRQVVNKWNAVGNVITVLGFSGTPYLYSPDNINIIDDKVLRFSQISNTVYYYPLISGIRSFLKKPTVKIAENLDPVKIIQKGVKDFYENYKSVRYENGAIAKLAIYCGNIERLETEIYPALTKFIKRFGDSPENILKYHKGNKTHKLPKENELEYNSLDLAISEKRIILLVQVGKEGWDCRSLTGVILSQRGDCPNNMILQTSCRCLRQVDKGKTETALIWLNDQNATVLNRQLKEEQHTSIEEINRLGESKETDKIERISRIDFLQLPKVDFYQLRVVYKTIEIEDEPDTMGKLSVLFSNLEKFKSTVIIRTKKNFKEDVVGGTSVLLEEGSEITCYNLWSNEIVKESFGTLSVSDLDPYQSILQKIFLAITFTKSGHTVYNELYDQGQVKSNIRLAFWKRRYLETMVETIPEDAELLITENLVPFYPSKNYYPENLTEVQKILDFDIKGLPINVKSDDVQKAYDVFREQLSSVGMADMITFDEFSKKFELPLTVKVKNQTFHYLPYNFSQSGYEKVILKETLILDEFATRGLEVYYNGDRPLTGFKIKCFAKEGVYWRNIGKYTPDFLIIKRKERAIHKVLILETKGEGYSTEPEFNKKKNFVETNFLSTNNENFHYKRFDYLYIQDNAELESNLRDIKVKLIEFFND